MSEVIWGLKKTQNNKGSVKLRDFSWLLIEFINDSIKNKTVF